MPRRVKVTSWVPPVAKTAEGHTQLAFKPGRRRGSVMGNDKTCVSLVAKSAGGGGGRSSGKAKSELCDPQPAAALTGRVTPSVRSRPPNVNRNAHPNATGPAGSEGGLRRSSVASHCVVCGESNHVTSRKKNLRKQAPKRSRPESEPRTVEFKVNRENTVGGATDKIIVWINQYPKVTLCDVAKKCDACRHNCGYVLPDIVKNKVVRCFKREMRAGFRFWPGCFGHDRNEREASAQAKSNKCCPSVPDEERSCQPRSLDGHLEEGTDSRAPSCQTAKRFRSCRTREDSATRSAFFSSGRHAKKGEYGTGVWGRDALEDTGLGSDPVGVEIHRDKRMKLGDSVVSSSTCGSAVKENCIAKNPRDQRGIPAETNGVEMSSEPFCEEDEVGTDEAESFTCQRVKAYVRKIHFSCARTYVSWPFLGGGPARAATAASSAGSIHSSVRDSPSVKANLNEASSSSDQTKNLLPDAHLEAQIEDDESILGRRNGKRHRNASLNTDGTNTGIIGQTAWSEESVSFSFHSQHGTEPGVDAALASPLLVNGPETYSSMSTPSPSALGLSDWETLSAASDPSTKDGPSRLSATPPSLPPSSLLPGEASDFKLKTVENLLFHCKETRLISCGSLSSAPPNSDSSRSGESSPLLPQDTHRNDEFLPERSPPKLEPYYYTSPIKHGCSFTVEHCVVTDSSGFMLPPVLSPVTSPQMHSFRSSLSSQSSSSSEEEEEEMSADANENKAVTECQMSQIVNRCTENSTDCHEEREAVSMNFNTLTASDAKGPDDCNEEESREESDDEDDVEQGKRSLEQLPLNPKIKASLGSGVLTEAHSPSSDEEDDEEVEQNSAGEVESRPCKISGGERDRTKAGSTDESQPDILNEFTAYEQDILLVDVIQDDSELFDNLPERSLLKLGPARATEAPKRKLTSVVKTSLRIDGTPAELDRRFAPGTGDFDCDSLDNTEESDSRPWRPRRNTTPAKMQNTCPATNKQPRHGGQSDANNNHTDGDLERSQPIHTGSPHNIPQLMSGGTGPWIKNASNGTDLRRQKSNAYCRQFFSESLSCGFKMCRFQHLPVEGDEKFCVETVARFTKNPACLQKAGAVFTGYYHNNPPGVYFSVPVLLSLLRALLKAGMVSDVFSALSVSLAHSIVPGHEFLLDLFNFVREKGLMGLVPELMQLTFKMASVGLELSLDCLDCVKNAPMFQQTVHPNSTVAVSANHKLSTAAHFPAYLNLAHAVVEIELCTKQEDWKRIGEVFRSICQSSHHPNQVERISGRITIALLCESKDKLSLPFAAFAETVCQNEGEDSLIKSFVGRIGVSLMLRYHKTHQWAKGRRVVEIMSSSKVGFTTLKGLFGNEDGASRCSLVTVATELLLLSGSVEGALNTLRENKWFLSSSLWPCEPADLESRTRVLMRLAEKTSHRDTLEVLSNLPGIKEPNDLIDISRYSPLFKSHLQVCVDRLMLPVASDMVDFMLSKNLAVEHSLLQTLLHKLGKQNIWLRAREVFRRSLSAGYYPGVSAPPGDMALIVPCELGEVELALAFEMFITVNASVILPLQETTTSSLSITLKRNQSCESEYLSAGSRLLSAACIPQPKLIVHYTAVNSSQEQVFRLDVSTARRWLRHNHLWAGEVWTH